MPYALIPVPNHFLIAAMVTPELWAGLWGGILGGLLGFAGAIVAVVIDRRIERKHRRQDAEKQLQEIAKALAFEVDGFYRHYLTDLRETLQARIGPLKSPPTHSFPVYHANAHRIGEFDGTEIEAVVAFFSLADSLMSTLGEAVRLQSENIVANNPQTKSALMEVGCKLHKALPDATAHAREAARKLASRAGIPFVQPTFAIAESTEQAK